MLNGSFSPEGGHGEQEAPAAPLTKDSDEKAKLDALTAIVNEKELEHEEDFFAMTIFSYLKSNAALWDDHHDQLGWGIKAEKQA